MSNDAMNPGWGGGRDPGVGDGPTSGRCSPLFSGAMSPRLQPNTHKEPCNDPGRSDPWEKTALLAILVLLSGCLHKTNRQAEGGGAVTVIQCAGSDTIVNVAQAWAEAFADVDPDVSVEVSGGGSGTGIAGLINRTLDIANASRKMTEEERKQARANTGQDPLEHVVGYDALAIFVHKDNPLEEISLEQLADIYGEKGPVDRWSQLGVTMPDPRRDKIIVTGRQSNSGTYFYFREAILGKKGDFRLGTLDLHGSKDVTELIGRTVNAIGYTGMGYATPHVKMLRISKKAGDAAIPPAVSTTLDGTYPIARPLLMYTHGTPSGPIQKYLDWIRSPAGQAILVQSGYVPVTTQLVATGSTPTGDAI